MLEIIRLYSLYGTAKMLSLCPPTPAFIIHLVRHDRLQYWLISSVLHYMSINGLVKWREEWRRPLISQFIAIFFHYRTEI